MKLILTLILITAGIIVATIVISGAAQVITTISFIGR